MDPIVSIIDKIPILLKIGSQKILIKNQKKIINEPLDFKLRFLGKKFIKAF